MNVYQVLYDQTVTNECMNRPADRTLAGDRGEDGIESNAAGSPGLYSEGMKKTKNGGGRGGGDDDDNYDDYERDDGDQDGLFRAPGRRSRDKQTPTGSKAMNKRWNQGGKPEEGAAAADHRHGHGGGEGGRKLDQLI